MNIAKKTWNKIHSSKKGSDIFSVAIGIPALFMMDFKDPSMIALNYAFIASWVFFATITMCSVEKASFIKAE